MNKVLLPRSQSPEWQWFLKIKKVQAGKDQEKAQSEKVPTPKTEVGKNQTNNQVLIP